MQMGCKKSVIFSVLSCNVCFANSLLRMPYRIWYLATVDYENSSSYVYIT